MSVLDVMQGYTLDMVDVEERLASEVNSGDPILREASTHLLRAGGKRIRPLFVLLSGQFGTYDRESLLRVATALELIHMATLVHDDVIDDAAMRRGIMTVKNRWDNRVAMYTGDFIFARALFLLSELPHDPAHRSLSSAIVRMCQGEIEQLRDFYNLEQSTHTYLRRIRRKTALLIGVSCLLGALVCNASEHVVTNIWLYGLHAGMAFQMTDDILDFTSTAAKLGKPVGSDLRQGNITLPVIHALKYSPKRDELHALIHPLMTNDEAEQAISIVMDSGGIEATRSMAQQYLDKSLTYLSRLEDCPSRQALTDLARFIHARDR